MTRRMADSISLANLPAGFDLYAGYDDGAWPDAAAIASRFPGRTVIRITTNPADNEGDCLDVEQGDAQPADAPTWVARRRAAGHGGPLVYCSESAWPTVRQAFMTAAVPEPGWWVAAYPGEGAVIPAGAVAHQWIDRGPYDESVVIDYLPGIDPAPEEELLMPAVVTPDGKVKVYAIGAGDRAGQLLEFTRDPADPAANAVIDVTDQIGGADPYTISAL